MIFVSCYCLYQSYSISYPVDRCTCSICRDICVSCLWNLDILYVLQRRSLYRGWSLVLDFHKLSVTGLYYIRIRISVPNLSRNFYKFFPTLLTLTYSSVEVLLETRIYSVLCFCLRLLFFDPFSSNMSTYPHIYRGIEASCPRFWIKN